MVGQTAFILPFVVVTVRLLDTFLMAAGVKHNPFMDGVVGMKYSAQLPDEAGHYGPKPADQQVCVFLIGARCNQYATMYMNEKWAQRR